MKLKTPPLALILQGIILAPLITMIYSCASGVLQYQDVEKLEINEEYDKMISVKEISPPSSTGDQLKESPGETSTHETQAPVINENEKVSKTKEANSKETAKLKPREKKIMTKKKMAKSSGKKKNQKDTSNSSDLGSPSADSSVRLPELEDAEGFNGRRPLVDPFGTNEKVVLDVTYFGLKAGELALESRPLVEVNGRKSYHFVIRIKSYSFFDRIYSVDDWAETFLDFEHLTPYNLAVHIKESKQIKESRSVYDFSSLEANFWEKQVTKDKGEKNKKVSWKIDPFSQNVLSAIFYLRTFTMRVGKILHFKIADAGKNILFRAEVVREETLERKPKALKAVVLKLEFKQDGVFQKTGDVFLWLTHDERKFPVRIESKIKIGTLVGSLQTIVP